MQNYLANDNILSAFVCSFAIEAQLVLQRLHIFSSLNVNRKIMIESGHQEKNELNIE